MWLLIFFSVPECESGNAGCFDGIGLPIGIRFRANQFAAIISQQPNVWEVAHTEELKYYNAIADCLAQCAAAFGGGVTAFGDYPLLALLRWTHRAVLVTHGDE